MCRVGYSVGVLCSLKFNEKASKKRSPPVRSTIAAFDKCILMRKMISYRPTVCEILRARVFVTRCRYHFECSLYFSKVRSSLSLFIVPCLLLYLFAFSFIVVPVLVSFSLIKGKPDRKNKNKNERAEKLIVVVFPR